ncbi:hypothetical protein [Phenylobacterium sp.]|uniref:hypothetical protein n=1 Tax=Phenylobacterium sp. TaxID=1871053 RepID=UPI002BAB4F36|nr:hypothetical protein [Phenylobacterium sp.]HLZ74747.1 hypothetical protein [Phenylobacterium sp.]
MDESDVIAQARVIYERMQADLLAASPLAGMAEWVASGVAPPAADLRSRGFAGPDDTDAPEAANLRLARKAFVREWGFAIPCAEAVAALRRLSPIVEVGAGAGCWTALLRAAGHDMIATDLAAGDTKYGFAVADRGAVEQLGALEAVRKYPDRDLFCSWPSEGEPWAAEAILGLAPGRRAALILDDRGTLTGDETLRGVLAQAFRPLETVTIPQFPGVCDRLHIYERLAG